MTTRLYDKDAYLNQSSSRTSVRTDYGSPQTIEVGRPHLSGYSNWFSNYCWIIFSWF